MTVSRRVLLFWLLLLLPTLGVGGGAFWLLHREQARLDAQAATAAEARRATIEARARLIVENIELFMDDLQSAVMDTLRDVPPHGADDFLDRWEKTNPLIQTSFRTDTRSRLVRPAMTAQTTPLRSSLQAWLNAGRPLAAAPMAKTEVGEALLSARREVSKNVATVQSARSAVKDAAGPAERSAPSFQATPVVDEGWTVWRDPNGIQLIGWHSPTSVPGTLVGVVLQASEIRSRMESLLPREGELADAFILRERGGDIIQEKRYRSTSSPAPSLNPDRQVVVPITSALLLDWEVVGVIPDTDATGGSGRGFLIVGGLLVLSLMTAILAGGGLLLHQARQSEAEAARKTSFVANISHEFKTPLTTLRLYAELLLQKRVKTPEQAAHYLRVIGEETERLTRLVNNALDFSRLEQGRKPFHRVSLDLVAEVHRVLDIQIPRLEAASMKLHRELPPGPVTTSLDRDALEQILLNLLDNACKYASVGGEVTVTLTHSPRESRLCVSDRGPGVPADHRERIFDKFHRVNESLTVERSGAGLGLSIARQLARGLGGDLRHESRPGGGSTFVLTLP